jgi:hypothetical protein
VAWQLAHWSLSYLSYSVDKHSKGTVRLGIYENRILALGLNSFCNSEYEYLKWAKQQLLLFNIIQKLLSKTFYKILRNQ